MLSLAVRPAAPGKGVDLRGLGLKVARTLVVEHVHVVVRGEAFRLDIIDGTVTQGPVAITFLLDHDTRLLARVNAVGRLVRLLAGRPVPRLADDRRFLHALSALAAWDARNAGHSLRAIADQELGPGEWPGPGEWRKSAARRLVAAGESLVAKGPRWILAR